MPQKSSKNYSDEELVGLSLENSNNFALLIKKYEFQILRYIQRISGLSKENSEDVLQNTFIKVYQNLNGFNPIYKFSSWIYRIAHNETITFLRKHKNQPKVLDMEESDAFLNTFASDFDLQSDLNKKEIKKEISNILNNMSEKYREVLVLKFLEERDYQEISDILKKPVGTVGTLINRAKKQFRKIAVEHGFK